MPYYVKVGRYCSIAPNVSTFGYQHPLDRISTASFTYEKNHRSINDASERRIGKKFPILENIDLTNKKINIENDVWIGEGALLKQGVTLGNGCVVGQRAVVTKNVPPYAIVVGIPAKVVKYRFDEHTIKRLLKIQWWNYHFADFHNINIKLPINKYIDILENMISKGKIEKYISNVINFYELSTLFAHPKT
ncbi:CatB-related O-acetyltransferase [Campylobacter lari]|uniref:CatB-related O-acetyltransferase n=1 Tax=Campylobacter lari TaxID=201 RepID=UPI0020252963|nr:CatB-related O-acetyltransferase [Campylobacter lari]MCV3458940.1 CatB-related O-acetyltransferase [Campylobacter lari]